MLSKNPIIQYRFSHTHAQRRARCPVQLMSRSCEKCCQCAYRRPTYQYEAEHIEGAVNVPTFRPVAGKGKWDIIKKIAMAGLAMKATGQHITASWHSSIPSVRWASVASMHADSVLQRKSVIASKHRQMLTGCKVHGLVHLQPEGLH